jgi:hypothetical protein
MKTNNLPPTIAPRGATVWLLALLLAPSPAPAIEKPFPQHAAYVAASLSPTHATPNELDLPVREFHARWRAKYLRVAPGAPDQRFVDYNAEGHAHKGNDPRSVSEGHGYGMLATVLMADVATASTAQADFDGLYRFFRAHPSRFSPDLMAWLQAGPKLANAEGDDSAADGDLDIAYALLLADRQWGSGGAIDYAAEARKVMSAIMAHEVDQQRWTIQLGDWAHDDSAKSTAMRSSDFMPQHWRAFAKSSGDARWDKLRDQTYVVLAQLFQATAPKTGLMPDFIVLRAGAYQPPHGKFLEDKHDGDFGYNACRTPWRLATDYLVHGEARALPQLRALNEWAFATTGGDPRKFSAGYTLAGKPLDEDDHAACFIGPLAVSAMAGPSQPWLDRLWQTLLARDADRDDDYFSNSVKLLCLIVASGNWWSP